MYRIASKKEGAIVYFFVMFALASFNQGKEFVRQQEVNLPKRTKKAREMEL